jgi:hypothetical protein
MVRIEFETTNAAFEDARNETAWILRKLAQRIDQQDPDGPNVEMPIADSNGNTIGKCTLELYGRANVDFPTVDQIRFELQRLAKRIDWSDFEDPDDAYCEVRLRVWEAGWQVLWGDPCYDTDHRGYWGSDVLCEDSLFHEVAADLIEQAKDSYAECRETESEGR